ncbi:MAG: Gfo/Idh/MocA family oxidoreductase [Clostridia bacterium]|nr:Gfo/Idh/MocA family oxidoreductase [Clostridia bacterium]
MKKIKVAQIGTSRYGHGSIIFDTLAKNPDIFEIVGYALPENERTKFPDHMERFENYREMSLDEILSDSSIEAVFVETEEIYLTKYAILAAKSGKHVHMEKPGGVSLEEFEELIAILKEKKTVFHTGYMYRYNPVISDIIKRARSGEIGEILSVEAHMSCYHPVECTEWLSGFEGGMMFYLGCHLVDLVLQIKGRPDRIVPVNRSSGRFEGVTSNDSSFALFEYPTGASFVKTSAAECGGFSRRQLVVSGTKGRFTVCPLEVTTDYPSQYTEYNECLSTDWGDTGVWKRSEIHDRYEAMLFSFAEMVRGEKENPYSYDYELELFKVITECCK